MELELATTQQLLDELMSRYTFIGMVIYSPTEQKLETEHNNFIMRSSVPSKHIIQIMDHVKEKLTGII